MAFLSVADAAGAPAAAGAGFSAHAVPIPIARHTSIAATTDDLVIMLSSSLSDHYGAEFVRSDPSETFRSDPSETCRLENRTSKLLYVLSFDS